MSTTALEPVGHGAALLYNNGTTTNYTAISTLYDLTPNKVSITSVEITKLSSTATESQPGTPDHGEIQATIAFLAANTTLINGFVTNKTVLSWKLTVDDSTNVDSAQTFQGWVKEWEPLSGQANKDEALKSKITVKITGVGTFVAAT